MNFVKLYIGDYQRDTGHLSIAEHGAYLLMLQHFYATEKPLPTGKALHRLLRAESKAEREAIDSVTQQFWTEEDGQLVNRRALVEIRKADHQRTVNREVGKRGGRPPRTDPETDSVPRAETDSVPIRNPNQTPDTRHQTKDLPPASAFPSSEGGTPAGALSRALRSKGIASNPMDPRLIALAEAGMTPAQAAAAADEAREAKGANSRIPAGYVLAILERWRAEPQTAPALAYDPEAVAKAAFARMERNDAAA